MEKNLAQRLWDLFEDLLQVVIISIAKSGAVDMTQFKCSPEYGALKELFEESFLGNQLLQFNKTAQVVRYQFLDLHPVFSNRIDYS